MSAGALEEIAHQLEQLAIEQYTANLIAFHNSLVSAKEPVQAQELAGKIKDRLGL